MAEDRGRRSEVRFEATFCEKTAAFLFNVLKGYRSGLLEEKILGVLTSR
jgi:hypothetical protein